MEDLNKTQIILLCTLISFVVSIGTGIMTTTLLTQSPVTLTQTVQDVIERSVQTITPIPTPANPNPTPTTVQTVVVSEDDSVTNAVSKNEPSIVRIRAISSDGTIDNLYGMGLVVTAGGIIASDAQLISPAMNYVATMNDGTKVTLVPITGALSNQVQFFLAKPASTTAITFAPVNLSTSNLKLGQTVIALGGNTTDAVNVGRVISLNMSDGTSTSTPSQSVVSVDTNVSPTDSISGAPILDLSGNVVGLFLSAFASSQTYLPARIIASELQELKIAQ